MKALKALTFGLISVLLFLPYGEVNSKADNPAWVAPQTIDNDLNGALYCDCFNRVKTPGRWTITTEGRQKWIEARVERHTVPCPSNVLFLVRRYIA